jgi:polyphosphate kinase
VLYSQPLPHFLGRGRGNPKREMTIGQTNKAAIYELLRTYLEDNLQSWDLTADGTWVRRQPRDGAPAIEAQVVLLARRAGEGGE